MDAVVATEADAPDEVVFRRGIAGDEFCLSGGGDAMGAEEDGFFEATAADRAEALASGGHGQARAGPAAGIPDDGDEDDEDAAV